MPVGQEAAAPEPAQPVAEGVRARRHPVVAFVVAVRPHQWVKNLFVGAPLIFAKSLFDAELLARAAAAVALFCLIAGAVYLWNDLVDLDKDRVHPRKRFRPIAAGELPVVTARAAAATLATLGLAGSWWLDPRFAAAAAAYLGLNVAYSLRIKHIAYVDVLAIAAGFLLRVVAGALALDVHASPFLLLCTGLLASFVGFGKRAHELATSGERGVAQRAVLRAYRPAQLRVALFVSGAATLASYVFYTLAEHTREFFHTTRMTWTVPFVALGVGRFLMLVSSRPRAESPTEEMLRDPLFVANLVAWVATVVAIIYFA